MESQNYSAAWKILCKLGAPYRFAGKSFDGIYEYLILHPDTGSVVANGRAKTSAAAMLQAALAAEAVFAVKSEPAAASVRMAVSC